MRFPSSHRWTLAVRYPELPQAPFEGLQGNAQLGFIYGSMEGCGQISDNISLTLQDKDTVAMEQHYEILCGLSIKTTASAPFNWMLLKVT